jgi:hypothetical protein
MVTTLWVLFEFIQMMLTEFAALPSWKRWTIGIMTACLATYGYVSDHRDVQRQDAAAAIMNGKIDAVNDKMVAVQKDNTGLYSLVSKMAATQATEAAPGLKKEALELASTLLNRTTEILALQFTMYPSPLARISPQAQAATETQALIDDYDNAYAKQIVSLRQRFIEQGQTDWKPDQYYLNPPTQGLLWVQAIQQIGQELLTHANHLKNGNSN